MKRTNPLMYVCGCWECGICKGTCKEILDSLDPVQTKCSACNGTGREKMCKTHAQEDDWIKEGK